MSNKKILVTGASRGIGLEIAKGCLEKGWSVTGTAVSSSFPDSMNSNKNFKGVHVDLGQLVDVQATLKPEIENELPDVLINNAGVFRDADMMADDDEWLRVWDQTMNINLRSSSILTKWFINQHVKNGTEGIIINIASRAAYRGDTQEYAAYAASKAGMVAFTKSIARDFSRKNIFAYSVAPGFIETDMAKDAVDLLGKDYILKDSAFDEITQPDEVANLVVFLAEGKIRHASGQTFHINGGSYLL